jgi:hypothetical protein
MISKTLWIAFTFVSFLSMAQGTKDEQLINELLDNFHQAAAEAKTEVYLSSLTEDAIFLGTDGNERWNKQQFTAYVLPYFNQDKGWLYVVKERNISLLKQNTVAFFDEILENSTYGYCRGSGVLVQTSKGWKISQYSLSVLVPNDVAKKITEQIKNYEQQK